MAMLRSICITVAASVILLCGFALGIAQEGGVVVDSALVRLIEQVDVPARAAGVLTSFDVTEGDIVEEGDLLAEIDREEAELIHKRAQVELQISQQQAADDVAVRAMKESVAFAKNELKRIEQAHERLPGSISQSELEEKRLNVVQAGLQAERAEREFQQLQLQTLLKQRELELSRHNIDVRSIMAPIPGVIVEVLRHKGEWVEPGEKVLRILRIDRLRVEGLAPVGALQSNMKGARVSIVVDVPDHSEIRREGQATFVSPEVNAVNGQVRVWAEFDNPDGLVRPGLRAKMTIYP